MKTSRWPLALLLCGGGAAWAQDDGSASSAHEPGYAERTTLTGEWGGARTDLRNRGLEVVMSYALESFATRAEDGRWVLLGLGALGVDLDLARLATTDGLGSFHVLGFGIHGDGLTAVLGDVHGISNNETPPDVRLYEAWYEQPLGPAALRLGLLAVDQEFVIAARGTSLLGATFGMIGQVAMNLVGPVYPVATPGASGRVNVGPVTARAALYDGRQENRHGIPTDAGESALGFFELELFETFKLGGWVHSERADGAYLIADGDVHPILGLFARGGYSPDGLIELYADAGVRLRLAPFRPDDFASVGAAFSRLNPNPETMEPGYDEAVLEATYHAAATDWMTVQPDFQLVFEPDRTVVVGGMRVTLVF